jgi:hypothetical protein
LEWLRRVVDQRRPEGILFAGGVLELSRHYAAKITPWGLTHADGLFLEKFFATLGDLGVFSAIIPGPMDTPLEDFLRLGMQAEIDFPALHLVHATLVEKGDIAVCGLGGGLAEHPPCGNGSCSRPLAAYYLRPLWTARQPHKILLLSVPPTGPLADKEGNPLAGELIDSYHPSLCVVAGSSERRGLQRIAHTVVINPGSLAEGWAAWLDWNRVVDEQVELLNLRDLALARVATDLGVCD